MPGDERDQLIIEHRWLVWAEARDRFRRVPPGMREDLDQAGYLGLIKAADRYEPAKGVPFKSFAKWWIRGEMMAEYLFQRWSRRGRYVRGGDRERLGLVIRGMMDGDGERATDEDASWSEDELRVAFAVGLLCSTVPGQPPRGETAHTPALPPEQPLVVRPQRRAPPADKAFIAMWRELTGRKPTKGQLARIA